MLPAAFKFATLTNYSNILSNPTTGTGNPREGLDSYITSKINFFRLVVTIIGRYFTYNLPSDRYAQVPLTLDKDGSYANI